jgi:hypothetical protein
VSFKKIVPIECIVYPNSENVNKKNYSKVQILSLTFFRKICVHLYLICILEGLATEDVGLFCGHLIYFSAIWYTLWPFGIFYGYLVNFSRFGMLYEEKSGNLDCKY